MNPTEANKTTEDSKIPQMPGVTESLKPSTEPGMVSIPTELLATLVDVLKSAGQTTINPSKIVIKEKSEEVIGKLKVIEYDENDAFGSLEDMLDEPIVFFAYRSFHTVFDDSRAGACIQAPGGPIRFSNSISYPKANPKQGENPNYSISMAYIRSAVQAKFLREHSLFNIDFFEDVRAGKSIDPTKQEAIARAKQWVSSLSNADVKTHLIQRGGNITGKTIEDLRRDLIFEISNEEIQKKFQIIERSKQEFEEALNIPIISLSDIK